MTKIDKMCDEAVRIANDNSHGYNQAARWSPDFDCSSLVYHCAEYAGYNVPKSGTRYTGTMIEHFSNAGFRVDAFDGNLYDLERGDILLNTSNHTALYIGDNQIVEASIDERGQISGGQPGDQTGNEIHICDVYNYPWTHVLTAPVEGEPEPTENEIVSLAKRIIELAS